MPTHQEVLKWIVMADVRKDGGEDDTNEPAEGSDSRDHGILLVDFPSPATLFDGIA
jgi:hypothetical protein